MTPICACHAPRPPGEIERLRILRLLAVFEHPEALPPDLALPLGAEILALARPIPSGFLCEPA
ncbi:hypothetical protein MWN33_15675 [Starkeya koreensis]|uniref:Uncharacterized protein n=1 Tax=Ancylobacter koreensis TaxID=266121 RepID=A0ABT0DQA6_9HYPH|nr:hypothetical protein [Ancylobacter koreensis]MCK0209473.1 hypothetical protein [Ancylobacter koreensis]